MLELLLERGQSYDDIAGVLGTGSDDVRARAQTALAELGGAEPDPELTDYLLGQADPVGRADAVRRLGEDPEQHELAARLVAGLEDLTPSAQLPTLPPRRVERPSPDAPPAEGAAGLSRRQRGVMLGLALAAVAVLAIVLVVAGAFEGDDEPAPEREPSASAPDDAVRVELEPQVGGDARGEAVFGLATADQLFVDLDVGGLEAQGAGERYVVWLLLTPNQGYPISPFDVDENGGFSDRFPIPRFALPIAGRARFLDVGLVDARTLQAQVEDFAQGLDESGQIELPIMRYEGESALRGEIPATGGPALLDEGDGAPGS